MYVEIEDERDGRAALGHASGGFPGGAACVTDTTVDWLHDINRLFPKETIERLQRDAVERPQLAARRVAGVSVHALAGGAVVTESAARSASRTVRLSVRRLSRTEAMTARGSWQDLPRSLIATDLNRLAAEL